MARRPGESCRRQPRGDHQPRRRPPAHRGDQGIQAPVAGQGDHITTRAGAGVRVRDRYRHREGPRRQGPHAVAPQALTLSPGHRDHRGDQSRQLQLQGGVGRHLVEGGHDRRPAPRLDGGHRGHDPDRVHHIGRQLSPAFPQLQGPGCERRIHVTAGGDPHILDHGGAGGAQRIGQQAHTTAGHVGDVGQGPRNQGDAHRGPSQDCVMVRYPRRGLRF